MYNIIPAYFFNKIQHFAFKISLYESFFRLHMKTYFQGTVCNFVLSGHLTLWEDWTDAVNVSRPACYIMGPANGWALWPYRAWTGKAMPKTMKSSKLSARLCKLMIILQVLLLSIEQRPIS